eukprot:TRINITY_DN4844_c0_g1_i2.p1 TRINITY_DN4844_c0_g1~~TRINITY_DN4844_c0_g1_i2.p1  ORF type:complete len:790 (-),score=128.65 TRINITY_DN4844_c0_g1_i2:71-2440(-)
MHTGSPCLPLRAIKFSAQLTLNFARVEARQVYKNVTTNTLEVVFAFPLDKHAAVVGFAACVDGGTTVVGQLRPKEVARNAYEDATASSKRAFTLDETGDNVFSSSVGLLSPGKQVEVVVTYVTELVCCGGNCMFIFPVATQKALGVSAEARSPETEHLSGELHISGGPSSIAAITCDSHHCSLEWGNGKHTEAKLMLAPSALPSPDVEVLVTFSDFPSSVGLVPHQCELTKDECFCLAVTSILDSHVLPKDLSVSIVVDRSGSMSGHKWSNARQATELFLRSLPIGCQFDVIGFGSHYQRTGLQEYSEESFERTWKIVSHWQADLGGTALLPPLQEILANNSAKFPRLIVITDGQTSNTNEALSLVSTHRAKWDVFTLGIGDDVDEAFLDALATKKNAEYLSSSERLEAPVIRQLKRALGKEVAVNVDWGNFATNKDFVGQPLVWGTVGESFSAFCLGKLPLHEASSDVTLSVHMISGEIKKVVHISAELGLPTTHTVNSIGEQTVSKLAARTLTNYLLTAGLEKQALAISLQFGVLTKIVAFSAVCEEDTEAVVDTPVLCEVSLVKQPQHPVHFGQRAPALWRVSGAGGLVGAHNSRSYDCGAPASCRIALSAQQDAGSSAACCGGGGGSSPRRNRNVLERTAASPTAVPSPEPPAVASPAATATSALSHAGPEILCGRAAFTLLMSCQNPSGFFTLTPEAAAQLGIPAAALDAVLFPVAWVVGGAPHVSRVWHTALVLAFFEQRLASMRTEWELVGEKAAQFVAAALTDDGSCQRIMSKAKIALSTA